MEIVKIATVDGRVDESALERLQPHAIPQELSLEIKLWWGLLCRLQ